MVHVVQARYENGTLRLEHPLPLQEHEQVRVTVERFVEGNHSVLDIPPVRLGDVLARPTSDEDLLGEMLEGRP